MTQTTATSDIHAYLAELEDIPGTRVYTAARARKAANPFWQTTRIWVWKRRFCGIWRAS